jgi:hypothetical protein
MPVQRGKRFKSISEPNGSRFKGVCGWKPSFRISVKVSILAGLTTMPTLPALKLWQLGSSHIGSPVTRASHIHSSHNPEFNRFKILPSFSLGFITLGTWIDLESGKI